MVPCTREGAGAAICVTPFRTVLPSLTQPTGDFLMALLRDLVAEHAAGSLPTALLTKHIMPMFAPLHTRRFPDGPAP